MSTDSTWKSLIEKKRQSNIEDLIEFLKIPSISTDEASVVQVKVAAQWVVSRMKKAGIENIKVSPTGFHECVYGDWLHAPGKPTILIYGHFDVQPPDPLDLWESPPFEPMVKDGKIFARGAADMKGNLLLTIIAFESLLAANGSLPVNVKFLFEGQEEIGSRDLGPYIAAHREELACDLVLTSDGLQWADDQPAIWLGTKGLCALQVDLETAEMDLHSGLFGGAVPNATHVLVELLSTLRNREGKILVDGFYDDVVELSAEEKAAFASVPFDEKAFRGPIGTDTLVGEPGYTTYERLWARPTLDVNGLWGGYQGDGVKTVIPAKAHGKITCRLVANQEPEEIQKRIEAHLHKHCPPGARMTVTLSKSSARPYLMPIDNLGVQAVGEVLEKNYGRKPYFVRVGGSLPITDLFLQELKAYTISVGLSLDDERAHSPNEFMRLHNFERGQVLYAEMLERLGQETAGSF